MKQGTLHRALCIVKRQLIIVAMATLVACTKAPVYTDSSASVEQRVEDLLKRMTLEEKVGQMNQLVGVNHIRMNDGALTEEEILAHNALACYPGYTADSIEQMVQQGLVGSFLHVVTLTEANYLQSLALQSRLGIPILFGIDAIHGNAKFCGCTVYPTNIGVACSFDTAMAYRIAQETAQEMRACNMHWTFNPDVEIARDPRWGRCGETYGEDPYLVSLMGAQTVRGFEQNNVLSCLKHLVAGGQSSNGTNGAPADLSERTLREMFFPPFQAGIAAGAGSVMMAHNELNGVPCHTNAWLMTDILRKEWHFHGFIVSDWIDIERVAAIHHTATDNQDAYYQAILAGIDMHMHGPEWQQAVVELVRQGKISEKRIDQSVRRILTAKFQLGLFEHPYATAEDSARICFSEAHQQTALQASEQSIVLLKNDGILPLQQEVWKGKHILVTGINADDANIMGDWTDPQPADHCWTVLRGLQESAPEIHFDFVNQGWDPRNMDPQQVQKAAQVARTTDLNIVVCGEYMARYRWHDRTGGEDSDRSDNYLVGLQEELIRQVAASGKPTILIYITGRPLSFPWAQDNLSAILYAWEPGQMGGKALARILWGEVNPSAKMAISVPYHVGQCQMIYNHKPSLALHPYVLGPTQPLYAFGEGLSYTRFAYSNAHLQNDTLFVDVSNTGEREGVEITQLYVHDDVASVTRPVKELKAFRRTALQPGQTVTLTFPITDDMLAFYTADNTLRVEPGTFTFMVGGSSKNEDLLKVVGNR